MSAAHRRQAAWASVFFAPAAVLFLLTVAYPLVQAFWLSLHDWPMLGKPAFNGLANYVRMWKDPLFVQALKVTTVWTLTVVPAIIVLGLVSALLLNLRSLRLRGFFRTVYFVPVVTNMVAAAFVWRWLFEPTNGVINYFLASVGLPGPGWLASTKWALPAMIVVGIWKQVGFAMVVFLAGLQTIPASIYEAAAIDGANSWQVLWRITLPLLNPTVVFNSVILVINAFRVFTIPYVMSSGGFTYGQPGGPLDSTRVFVIHIYDLGFKRLDLGYASANAMFLLAVILLVTLLQLRVLQRPVEY